MIINSLFHIILYVFCSYCNRNSVCISNSDCKIVFPNTQYFEIMNRLASAFSLLFTTNITVVHYSCVKYYKRIQALLGWLLERINEWKNSFFSNRIAKICFVTSFAYDLWLQIFLKCNIRANLHCYMEEYCKLKYE